MNTALFEELFGIFGDDLTQVEPEDILGIFRGESHDTLRISLPTVVAEALETRAYDEHRTLADITLLALVEYLQTPMNVRPRPKT